MGAFVHLLGGTMTDTFIKTVLTDASFMIKEELEYIKTGKHSGQTMRDCRGQWESLLRDLRKALQEMNDK